MNGLSRFPEVESSASVRLLDCFNTLLEALDLIVIRLSLRNQHEVCHGKLLI
jgi:hypothetical protein